MALNDLKRRVNDQLRIYNLQLNNMKNTLRSSVHLPSNSNSRVGSKEY